MAHARPTARSFLRDLPPEPIVIRTDDMKTVRDTGVLDLRQHGYRRAMQEANNRTAEGRLYELASSILGCEASRIILFSRNGFRQMFNRVPNAGPTRLGEVDAVEFTIKKGLRRLRRMVPPTIPHPLSINAHKFVEGDPDFLKFADGVKKRTNAAAGNALPSEILQSTGTELMPHGPALNNHVRMEYMRAELRAMRNLPTDLDISLYLGGTDAEEVIFGLLSHSGRRVPRPKTGMQCHEYDLAMQAALALNHDVRRIKINYEDPRKSEIPDDLEVIFLSIPNNPTGHTLDAEKIKDLLDVISTHSVESSDGSGRVIAHDNPIERTVILDVVGYDTTNDKQTFVAELVEIARRRLGIRVIIVDSASKSEEFAGSRLGWAWCNHREFNDLLKQQEIKYMSPFIVRDWRKRKNHMREKNVEQHSFREQVTTYLEGFHDVLRKIIAHSGGRVSIYNPRAAQHKDPRGYYITLQFKDAATAAHYLEALQRHGLAEQYLDREGDPISADAVELPLVGTRPHGRTRHRKPRAGERIRVSVNNRGMPYLDGKYVRLCAVGPGFQLAALAEAVGIN